jgi:hypothetical protein
MPDLWKALGDVYGEAGPDARPVATERSADARVGELTTSLPLDDDLAAALSAALVDGPRTPPPASSVPPPAPAAPAAPIAADTPPVAAPVAPAAGVAPVAPVAPAVTQAPVAPAAAPIPSADAMPAGAAGERVSAWLADISARQRLREQGPDLDAVIPDTPVWQRGDDDILPAAGRAKGKKRGRRG